MASPETPRRTPTQQMLRWFRHGHLPAPQQAVVGPIQDLAMFMDDMLHDSAEKTAGLRKLLEAKDCFVRASLPDDDV